MPTLANVSLRLPVELIERIEHLAKATRAQSHLLYAGSH